MHKKLVVFSGAGMSAESGIKTFRANDGLWENHRIEDVATPEAFRRDPTLVLEFYNMRRKQVMAAQPNAAHVMIAELQHDFDVQVITQNIDDLHERAGSEKVLHLHGEIMKARSTSGRSEDENEFYPVRNGEINLGDICKNGFQLRPHVVWFGEAVPMMESARMTAQEADIFIIVGTSLSVYPAAGLVNVTKPEIPKYLIDPGTFDLRQYQNLQHIRQNAVAGMEELMAVLK